MKKFAYLDKAGILHVVKDKETAEKYCAGGKVVETEVEAKGGYPMAMYRGHLEEIIVYDEETMKVDARSLKIEAIPELAELYKACR